MTDFIDSSVELFPPHTFKFRQPFLFPEQRAQMVDRRTIGIKLNEEQIASLNLKLKQSGYTSIADMVRAYLSGSFSTNEESLERLSDLVSEKVVQKLTLSTLAKAQPEDSLMKKEPRAGFDPATYCLQGN